MPVTYRIDPETRCLFSNWSGTVTDDEFIAATRQIFADPLFNPDFFALADLTRIQVNLVTEHSIKEVAGLNRFSPQARRAILVARDLEYGLFRMYHTENKFHGKPTPRVFRDRVEAIAWLNEGRPPNLPPIR